MSALADLADLAELAHQLSAHGGRPVSALVGLVDLVPRLPTDGGQR